MKSVYVVVLFLGLISVMAGAVSSTSNSKSKAASAAVSSSASPSAASGSARLANKSLEKDLKDLDVQDAVPSAKLQERIYAVQARATPLKGKRELALTFGQVISGSDFLSSAQFGLEGQYHFNDRWFAAAAYSRVSNRFTASAESLQTSSGYLPDVDFAKSRLEARLGLNLFYGKFRFTSAQALSFDQYLGLGFASNQLRSGTSTGPVIDAGFAFYFPRQVAVHLGVKDYAYQENRLLTKGDTNNVQLYVQAGVLF